MFRASDRLPSDRLIGNQLNDSLLPFEIFAVDGDVPIGGLTSDTDSFDVLQVSRKFLEIHPCLKDLRDWPCDLDTLFQAQDMAFPPGDQICQVGCRYRSVCANECSRRKTRPVSSFAFAMNCFHADCHLSRSICSISLGRVRIECGWLDRCPRGSGFHGASRNHAMVRK